MTEQPDIDYVELVLFADIPTPTMKHLLLTIAALANENGRCRPSIARLAILTGLDRRTITRNLKNLEKDFWLYVERTGTPSNRETNFYELYPLKLRLQKVSLEGRGTMPLAEAQDPYTRGTVTPNTNHTPAPRPTAAPQAQAGGSGAVNKVREELDINADSLFTTSECQVTESLDPIFGFTEPENFTTPAAASGNPYEGREFITQAEFDEAVSRGFDLFDLPDVRDEHE